MDFITDSVFVNRGDLMEYYFCGNTSLSSTDNGCMLRRWWTAEWRPQSHVSVELSIVGGGSVLPHTHGEETQRLCTGGGPRAWGSLTTSVAVRTSSFRQIMKLTVGQTLCFAPGQKTNQKQTVFVSLRRLNKLTEGHYRYFVGEEPSQRAVLEPVHPKSHLPTLLPVEDKLHWPLDCQMAEGPLLTQALAKCVHPEGRRQRHPHSTAYLPFLWCCCVVRIHGF